MLSGQTPQAVSQPESLPPQSMKSQAPNDRQRKLRRITDELLQEIRAKMEKGDKLATDAELASRYKVSLTEIRDVLRMLQEQGVIRRQKAVGTHVLNPMAGKWITILCEMNVYSRTSDGIFSTSVINHLRDFLEEAELLCRVSVGHSLAGEKSGAMTARDFLSDVENERLAGVIALFTSPREDWMNCLHEQNVPIVGTNVHYPHHVAHDPWADLAKVIGYLLRHGRDRIAYIGWHEKEDDKLVDPRQSQALEDLQRCYPIQIRPEWLRADLHPKKSGAGWEQFRELWLASDEKPNALIIDNENFMPDVERAIAELNIQVPQDLMIVCFRTRGNDRTPRIPTVFLETDPRLFAFRMFETFMCLHKGERPPSQTPVVPRFLLDDNLHRANSPIDSMGELPVTS
jgi:DNA-binding LacI/PurR family transcriptional regulator/ribosomal protein S25